MTSTMGRLFLAGMVLTAFACKKKEAAPAAAGPGTTAMAGSAATKPAGAAPVAAPSASPCSNAASKGSRSQTNGDSCIDYTGSAWTAEQIKEQSSQAGWTYSASPCPTANSVGACAYSIASIPGKETVQRHYVSSKMTAAVAEGYCKGNIALTGVFCP